MRNLRRMVEKMIIHGNNREMKRDTGFCKDQETPFREEGVNDEIIHEVGDILRITIHKIRYLKT